MTIVSDNLTPEIFNSWEMPFHARTELSKILGKYQDFQSEQEIVQDLSEKVKIHSSRKIR